MIANIWGPLKAALKVQTLVIDNAVFRLHYRLTAFFLVASALLVTATQYFGNPINCVVHKPNSEKVIDTFCWTHYTFSVVRAFDQEVGVNGVIYHGVDKHTKEDSLKHHTYYQWVWFILFIQAGMFYLPRYLWKIWEGGKIKILTEGLSFSGLGGNPNDKGKAPKKKIIVDYLSHHGHLHRFFIVKYIFCEIANLVNVVGQIYLLDVFLGGEFRDYGSQVIKFALEGDDPRRTDPMTRVFPRMTKCKFFITGPTGDVEPVDAFCILPLNIINEKVFIFAWFWFLFLASLSALALAYRLVTLVSPTMRSYCLKAQCTLADDDCLQAASSYLSVGDWFLLYLLCKNVEPIFMRDILKEIQGRIYDTQRNKHAIKMEKFRNNTDLPNSMNNFKSDSLETV